MKGSILMVGILAFAHVMTSTTVQAASLPAELGVPLFSRFSDNGSVASECRIYQDRLVVVVWLGNITSKRDQSLMLENEELDYIVAAAQKGRSKLPKLI